MKIQQTAARQFDLIYRVVAANVGGMTQEHSLARPSPAGNCANWILGHLTNVQNGVMQLVAERPVWESDQLKRAGYDPIEKPANAIDWDTLRDRFLGSRDRCVAAVSALSDEALAETVPDPFGGTCSRVNRHRILPIHRHRKVPTLG